MYAVHVPTPVTGCRHLVTDQQLHLDSLITLDPGPHATNLVNLGLAFGSSAGAWRPKSWQLLISMRAASMSLAFMCTPGSIIIWATMCAALFGFATWAPWAPRMIVPKWFWNRPSLCSLLLGWDLTSVTEAAWSFISTKRKCQKERTMNGVSLHVPYLTKPQRCYDGLALTFVPCMLSRFRAPGGGSFCRQSHVASVSALQRC